MQKKIDQFCKRKSELTSSIERNNVNSSIERNDDSLKQSRFDINLEDLQADPGLRARIMDYHPNIRDELRRAYYLKGPCQPKTHKFPYRNFGKGLRRFNPAWFSEYSNWLEYSIAKDAVFCLCCFLFKPDIGEQSGSDSFVGEGFSNWKKKEKLKVHVGDPNSAHNQAYRSCEALVDQNQHIQTIFFKQSNQARIEYRTRLTASVDCIRYLLQQGLAFRGHDEADDSNNQGNFLTLLRFHAHHNKDVKAVVLENAPANMKLTSPEIQKEIINSIATEIINFIIRDIGDGFFSILIDESRDVSIKEQMAIVLRYVKNGCIIERFIGMVHVTDTTALSLKVAIDNVFFTHGLSISRLRGQGYDGASNMHGEFNGLKTLILKENEFAFFVHCFAHQLQLALVAVAKNHGQISTFFLFVANVVNAVGALCKRRDMLREKQIAKVIEGLNNGELSSGKGLNQSTSLIRAGDTRWGSHYGTLMSLITMFSSVIDVLEIIETDGFRSDQRGEATILLGTIQSFNFVFSLHLMMAVLKMTNELSKALQRKDQDIVNAMCLVKVCKQRLQMMRDDGWDSLLEEVSSFCERHEIDVPNMDDIFFAQGRRRRNVKEMTNLHYYRVELFYSVIDMQLQELNSRFSETNTELLLCMACLFLNDSFFAFDKQKIIRFAKYYPKEFSTVKLKELHSQLETYILDVHSNSSFEGLKGISTLAKTMVETKKDKVYPLVYLLVTLALILPVATATVERAFSAMNIVKNELRNRMGDQFMNDSLVVYVEKDIFRSIDNEAIIQRFQKMKSRRGQL